MIPSNIGPLLLRFFIPFLCHGYQCFCFLFILFLAGMIRWIPSFIRIVHSIMHHEILYFLVDCCNINPFIYDLILSVLSLFILSKIKCSSILLVWRQWFLFIYFYYLTYFKRLFLNLFVQLLYLISLVTKLFMVELLSF